jgi:hypothetical protein
VLASPAELRYPDRMRTQAKYAPGHTEHTADCMGEWAEGRRALMSEQTIACNHRLHLSDHFAFVCRPADCDWASNDETAVCPDHGFSVSTREN